MSACVSVCLSVCLCVCLSICPLIRGMNPRAEGPNFPDVLIKRKADNGCGWDWVGVTEGAIVISH